MRSRLSGMSKASREVDLCPTAVAKQWFPPCEKERPPVSFGETHGNCVWPIRLYNCDMTNDFIYSIPIRHEKLSFEWFLPRKFIYNILEVIGKLGTPHFMHFDEWFQRKKKKNIFLSIINRHVLCGEKILQTRLKKFPGAKLPQIQLGGLFVGKVVWANWLYSISPIEITHWFDQFHRVMKLKWKFKWKFPAQFLYVLLISFSTIFFSLPSPPHSDSLSIPYCLHYWYFLRDLSHGAIPYADVVRKKNSSYSMCCNVYRRTMRTH